MSNLNSALITYQKINDGFIKSISSVEQLNGLHIPNILISFLPNNYIVVILLRKHKIRPYYPDDAYDNKVYDSNKGIYSVVKHKKTPDDKNKVLTTNSKKSSSKKQRLTTNNAGKKGNCNKESSSSKDRKAKN